MHQRFRQMACVLLCGLTLLPGRLVMAAEGDVERTLAIVELRAGTAPSSLTLDYLKNVIATFREENTGDYILVDSDKVVEKIARDRDQVPGALTEERRVALTEARKKGIQFLDNADAANAIKALQTAERSYRAALAAPGSDENLRKEYLDVLAQLATAYVVAKDRDAAADVFRTVITTFGLKAPINDDNYRPDVVELFKSIIKEVNALQKGSVDVTSVPVGARIILSGVDRGATPGQVADLIPGNYAIRLQQGTATSLLHRIKIGGGATTKVNIDVPYESHLVLEEKNVGLAYPDYEAAKQRMQLDAVALGRDLEVNMVCLVGVMDQKLVTFLVDVGAGKIERTSSIKVPQVGISKRAITRVMATILGEKDGGVSAQVPAPTPQSEWYTSKGGLATGGIGLVALVVGGVFSPALFTTSVATTGDSAKDAAKVKEIEGDRTIAAASLIAGGVLGVVSATLFYLKAKDNAASREAAASSALGPAPLVLPPAMMGFAPTVFPAALPSR